MFSVSFVNNYISSLLESDSRLLKIEVEGEISSITYHRSGNIYFTIKDEKSSLSVMMYKGNTYSLTFRPKVGDKVVCTGRITGLKTKSEYRLTAAKVTLGGQGDLYRRFMELRAELNEKGMFDASYKKEIPKYIKSLGVVTSPTGAAIRDIVKVAKRRNPYVSIILYPSLVQGDGAAYSIAKGIATLDKMDLDLMIVGRGGGSAEDLWCFNEEVVADAIFASNTPIISAVGHEIDTTISDLVADLRAPTPSAAAELGVYDVYSLLDSLDYYDERMLETLGSNIERKKQKALNVEKRLLANSPRNIIEDRKRRIEHISDLMKIAMKSKIESGRNRLGQIAAGLSGLSPANRLAQGYSYVTKNGKTVSKVSDVKIGDEINVRVVNGDITAVVK